MTLLGELSLWVAVVMAAWGSLVSYAGGALRNRSLVSSGERAIYATLAFVFVASAGLWSALLRSDFSFEYVASYTSANLPAPYKFSAFWAGQSGSLLFSTLVLAVIAAGVVAWNRRRQPELAPFVAGTLSVVTLSLLVVIAFGSNPYDRLAVPPPDGRGLPPVLQHPAMLLQPPNLYLGYVATAVSFATVVAVLLTRRLDGSWLGAAFRWSMLSWWFLTAGIVLGMWWTYVEGGGGGNWIWDALKNASFLPWLTVTALLHSIVVQEKRGVLRLWNVSLILATFLLAIFGLFLAPAERGASVNFFAMPGERAWFSTLLMAGMAGSAVLVANRWRDLRTPGRLESIASREGSLALSTLLLVGLALSVLLGTIVPLATRAGDGTLASPGRGPFDWFNVALGIGLLVLAGVGPILAWRRASAANLRQLTGPTVAGVIAGVLLVVIGIREWTALAAFALATFVASALVREYVRGVRAWRAMSGDGTARSILHLVTEHRRRYGGYTVHLGIVVMVVSVGGTAFGKSFEVSLSPGETYTAIDPFGEEWAFVSHGVSRYQQRNRHVTGVAVRAALRGASPHLITSERRQYEDRRGAPTYEPSTEVGFLGTWRQHVTVVLAGVSGGETAQLRVGFDPLVRWLWVGGALMLLGGLFVMWPAASRRQDGTGYLARLERLAMVDSGRPIAPPDPTPDELARLDAAVRRALR